MLRIDTLTFSDFQINTYIISGENKECYIVDPGCYYDLEKEKLKKFIQENKYIPKLIINTHGHIDHIFGDSFVKNEYNLKIAANKLDEPLMQSALLQAQLFGLDFNTIPKIDEYIDENSILELDNEKIKILFVPGHSPGSIALYSESSNFVIAGDVLFKSSIGRTDLMGGNYETIINSIKTKLLSLNDKVIVYPGHGQSTTIGIEKRTNPFLI